MTTQLVIFDCDGVLVDSEPISNRIIAEELTEFGLPMNQAEALQLFAGGALSNVNDYFLATTGRPIPESFEPVYRRRTKEAFAAELEAVNGVMDILPKIPIAKCVGSNGPLHKIKFNLQRTQLEHFFGDKLYSAYDIGFWKPLPHLYLHAAREMGVAPEQCVVVEDSVHGVEAAVAAGMRVFAYTATTDAQKLEQAGAVVFDQMQNLPNLIFD